MNDKRSERGSLLVITLWMVAILSAFAIAIARYLSVELRIMRYRTARSEAEAMARSGVYVAMARLKADGTHGDEPYDWLGDPDWAFVQGDGADLSDTWELGALGRTIDSEGRLHGARAVVHSVDEERKLNLNQVPLPPSAANGMGKWLNPPELAARIADYIDNEQPPTDYTMESGATGLEKDESANPPYAAKNALVSRHEELLGIPGFSALSKESIDKFYRLTSPYLSAGAININTADAEVLRALGISDYTIGIIDQYRQGADGAGAHEQDGIFDQPGQAIIEKLAGLGWVVADAAQKAKEQELLSGMGVASQVFTVESTGESALSIGKNQATVTARVQAVVKRKECGQGMPEPCILAWNEW